MAAVSTKKQIREKEKVEQRKRLDEIKSLALRQGYVTEDRSEERRVGKECCR